MPPFWSSLGRFILSGPPELDWFMIDCTILYMIVTGTLDEKAIKPPWMTYDICHVFTIDKYIIYCLVIYPFHKEWGYSLLHYLNLMYLPSARQTAAANSSVIFRQRCGAKSTMKPWMLRSVPSHWPEVETHWVSATGNRREVVGCSEGSVFFCYKLGSTSKNEFEEVERFFF